MIMVLISLAWWVLLVRSEGVCQLLTACDRCGARHETLVLDPIYLVNLLPN